MDPRGESSFQISLQHPTGDDVSWSKGLQDQHLPTSLRFFKSRSLSFPEEVWGIRKRIGQVSREPEVPISLSDDPVRITVNHQSLTVPSGLTLAQALAAGGYGLDAPCGGRGLCGRCRVHMAPPAPHPVPGDYRLLSEMSLSAGWRLACLHQVLPGMEVSLESESFPVHREEGFHKGEIHLTSPRADGWLITRDPPALGMALDLGTTSLGAYLMDLETGETLGAAVMPNPQLPYGPDVISRLAAASDLHRARALRASIVEGINRLVQETLGSRDLSDLQALTLVGNTAMHHILLGLPLEQLGRAPYSPYDSESRMIRAGELDLLPGREITCFFPPLIWGFVGSDVTAGIQAVSLADLPGVNLYLDLGTNSEIVLAAGGRLVAAAAAAGPAFEGGSLSSGMRATKGAITGVSLGPTKTMEVLGRTQPLGITGSGMISFLADALDAGLVEPGGRLVQKATRELDLVARETPSGEAEVLLAPGVRITQGDIRQIQLAKGALAAGIMVLLSQAGLRVQEVDRLFLAGAFGNNLDPADALRVGLFPHIELDRIRPAGNAAGRGAQLVLLSSEARDRVERDRKKTSYLELATHHDFKSLYLSQLSFPSP